MSSNRETNRKKAPPILTKEDRIKGGKKKSKRKTLANRLKPRKYCNTKCPMYPCFLQDQTLLNPKKECILKQLPEESQRGIRQLFLQGQEGQL